MEKYGKYSMVSYNGRAMCLYEWAEEYGLSTQVLKQRMNAWDDIEKALLTPVRKCSYSIEYRGIEYTLRELSEYCGVNERTLKRRIFVENWSVEEAAETPMSRRKPGSRDDYTDDELYIIWRDNTNGAENEVQIIAELACCSRRAAEQKIREFKRRLQNNCAYAVLIQSSVC